MRHLYPLWRALKKGRALSKSVASRKAVNFRPHRARGALVPTQREVRNMDVRYTKSARALNFELYLQLPVCALRERRA